MSDLETRVSQALLHFRALELALHSPHACWELAIGTVRRPATLETDSNGVLFAARFEPVPEMGVLTLLCDGTELLAYPFEHDGSDNWLSIELTMDEEPARRP